MSQIPEFSLLTQTDQRLTISDVEPQLKNLKTLDIVGEVFIASEKLSQDEVRTFQVSPKIKATLVKVDHRSRAVKINHILRLATGKTIILHADDFEISASAIKAHLNFHHHDKSIASICFGMAWIKDKTIYNAWLENKGVIFGYQFKENAPYEKCNSISFTAAIPRSSVIYSNLQASLMSHANLIAQMTGSSGAR